MITPSLACRAIRLFTRHTIDSFKLSAHSLAANEADFKLKYIVITLIIGWIGYDQNKYILYAYHLCDTGFTCG